MQNIRSRSLAVIYNLAKLRVAQSNTNSWRDGFGGLLIKA
jgi:hypothetical protein